MPGADASAPSEWKLEDICNKLIVRYQTTCQCIPGRIVCTNLYNMQEYMNQVDQRTNLLQPKHSQSLNEPGQIDEMLNMKL